MQQYFLSAAEHTAYLITQYGNDVVTQALAILEDSYGTYSIDAYEAGNYDLLEDILES